jgi:hypothetical protein
MPFRLGVFLAHALRRAGVPFARRLGGLETASPGWTRMLARLTSRIDRTGPGGGYLLGVALGFLPCGFLYAALAAAAATADPLQGALAMLAFGLGTVPALVLVGIAPGRPPAGSGSVRPPGWRRRCCCSMPGCSPRWRGRSWRRWSDAYVLARVTICAGLTKRSAISSHASVVSI